MTLPVFSTPYVSCLKCGQHSEASVRWRPHTPEMFATGDELCVDEHLERTCRHCGYRWPEACVDSQP